LPAATTTGIPSFLTDSNDESPSPATLMLTASTPAGLLLTSFRPQITSLVLVLLLLPGKTLIDQTRPRGSTPMASRSGRTIVARSRRDPS